MFVTYPAIFSTMSFPNFWLGFFFVTMIFIGIDSQFGMVECVSYFVEDFRWKIKNVAITGSVARAVVCFSLFLLGLP